VWVSRDAAGREPEASRVEERLRSARGVVGTGVEYVRTVAHAMELHGIHDPLVQRLWARLQG
jgi:cation transport regulator ChaC